MNATLRCSSTPAIADSKIRLVNRAPRQRSRQALFDMPIRPAGGRSPLADRRQSRTVRRQGDANVHGPPARLSDGFRPSAACWTKAEAFRTKSSFPSRLCLAAWRRASSFTPTPLASMNEALAALIREPCGCFEQTSSTTTRWRWPKCLLSHHGMDPALVAKAAGLRDRLRSADRLRMEEPRLRMVRGGSRPRCTHGLRPDGIHRHVASPPRRCRHGPADP